jgi:phosphotransferase system HPr-like phosphotransfer protein
VIPLEFQIKITYASDVGKVASAAMMIPGQIEVVAKQGHYVVDAKSVMGLFSLDLSQPLTIEMQSEYAANFEHYKEFFRQWFI